MLKHYFHRNKVGIVQQSDLCHSKGMFSNVHENVISNASESNSEDFGNIDFLEIESTNYQINPNITPSQKAELTSLLESFKFIISDKPGVTRTVEHTIKLNFTGRTVLDSYFKYLFS